MREALNAATKRLDTISDTPRLDAELLMAHALGVTREAMILGGYSGNVPSGFAALIERRMTGEPLAYIVGSRDFMDLTLLVGPGVLIPRPDSETLIEAATEHFAGKASPKQILDLGTGSGALLLAALAHWPKAEGLGVDQSARALAFAAANAERNAMSDRAMFMSGNWFDRVEGQFDLILANPPYVALSDELGPGVTEYEPHDALYSGSDGLDDIRIIAAGLRERLAMGGVAVIEIGAAQRNAASALFEAQNFAVSCRRDLAGRDRALVVTV